jgi:hypothetical protein
MDHIVPENTSVVGKHHWFGEIDENLSLRIHFREAYFWNMLPPEVVKILSLGFVHCLVSIKLVYCGIDSLIVKHLKFFDGKVQSHLLHIFLPSLFSFCKSLFLYVWKSVTCPSLETSQLMQLPIIDFD